MQGNGNPNKLPGIPTGARPKVGAPGFGRNDSSSPNIKQQKAHLGVPRVQANAGGSSSFILDE
jgi:hypothetical protein